MKVPTKWSSESAQNAFSFCFRLWLIFSLNTCANIPSDTSTWSDNNSYNTCTLAWWVFCRRYYIVRFDLPSGYPYSIFLLEESAFNTYPHMMRSTISSFSRLRNHSLNIISIVLFLLNWPSNSHFVPILVLSYLGTYTKWLKWVRNTEL